MGILRNEQPRDSEINETLADSQIGIQYLKPQQQNTFDLVEDRLSSDAESEVEDEDDNELQPLLFVDINLGGDEQERIVVFEGDTAPQLAKNFCIEHNLDDETMEKLQELLE